MRNRVYEYRDVQSVRPGYPWVPAALNGLSNQPLKTETIHSLEAGTRSGYLPVYTGFLFSTNAVIPSFVSWVWENR